MTEKEARRFRGKIMAGNRSCLLWTGCKSIHGYGKFGLRYKTLQAHRLAWEVENGAIPEGMELDHFLMNCPDTRHLCSTSCVNPDHMRLATRAENRNASFAVRAATRVLGLSRRRQPLPEGVSMDKRKQSNPYSARLWTGGSAKWLGCFATAEGAHAAYMRAKAEQDGTGN